MRRRRENEERRLWRRMYEWRRRRRWRKKREREKGMDGADGYSTNRKRKRMRKRGMKGERDDDEEEKEITGEEAKVQSARQPAQRFVPFGSSRARTLDKQATNN